MRGLLFVGAIAGFAVVTAVAGCGKRPGLGPLHLDGGLLDASLPDAAPDAADREGVACGDSVCADVPCCLCGETLSCDEQLNYCCAALFAYFACDGPEDCSGGERCCGSPFPGQAGCCGPGDPDYEAPLCHDSSTCPGARPYCCPYVPLGTSTPAYSRCEPSPCPAP